MAPRRQQGMHAGLASGVGRHFDPGQLALTGFRRITAVLNGRPGSPGRSWLRRRACPAVGQ